MPFEITIDHNCRCIKSCAIGTIDMTSLKHYFGELAIVLKESGLQRVLVDGRDATIQLTAMDVFSIPRIVAKIEGLVECRRAMVTRPGVSGPELFAMASQSRNQRVRIFSDYDLAVDWLLSEDD